MERVVLEQAVRCDAERERWSATSEVQSPAPLRDLAVLFSGRFGEEQHSLALVRYTPLTGLGTYHVSIAITAGTTSSDGLTRYSCNDEPDVSWMVP